MKSHCTYGSDDCKICKRTPELDLSRVFEDPTNAINKFYKLDGVNVNNTLLLVSKLFENNGWNEQSSSEAVELLRPLFIYLDRHKHLLIKCAEQEMLQKVVKLYGTPNCEHLHHSKKDYHAGCETCPVVSRIESFTKTLNN